MMSRSRSQGTEVTTVTGAFFRVNKYYHFWWIECAGTSLSAVNVGNFF